MVVSTYLLIEWGAMMERAKKIYRVSRVGYFLSWLLAILSFLIPVLVWITAPNLFQQSALPIAGLFDSYGWLPKVATHFSAEVKWIGFLITLLPTVLIVCCWLNAVGLFKGFRQQSVYSAASVLRLRRIGWLLLATELLQIPMQFALSAYLTIASHANGHGQAVISLGGADFGMIGVAVVLLLASWVLDEGVHLKQENESIV